MSNTALGTALDRARELLEESLPAAIRRALYAEDLLHRIVTAHLAGDSEAYLMEEARDYIARVKGD